MKSKLLAKVGTERTFVVVLDSGEEAFGRISDWAIRESISSASLTAIGAFEQATIGWFDFAARQYREIPVFEQCEVLSVVGDIAKGDDGKPSLHMHVVLGLSDGSTRGGHLLRTVVRPTLEVVIVETGAHLRRTKRPELGVALIDLSEKRSHK